ncbi:MAG TPA: glutamate mutase L, partial [Ktedonobacteraceae bacterium]|nr:glutamate mutase L [Ktedonobacteraceae bacterium]
MSTQPYVEGGKGPNSGANPSSVSSILVADCGTVLTKVSLLGIVENQYRLMARGEAPTTITPPYEDITKGIIQAINVIEFITGRHFISEGRIISPEQPIGDGVDVFIATISAGGPLRVVVLGAVDSRLEELTRQAVSGLYAETHALPAPSFIATTAAVPVAVGASNTRFSQNAGGQWTPERVALEWERQIECLRELQPQAALIVGIADGPAGPAPLQEACQLLVSAANDSRDRQGAIAGAGSASRPPGSQRVDTLYAGAPQYIEAVRRMLQGNSDVTRVDPLITQAQIGPTSIAAGALYDRKVMQKLPGFAQLQNWSASAPMTTATSLSSLVRFLAQHYAMNVTAVDIGGATTTLMLAGESGEFIPMVNAGIGIGPGLGAILQRVGLQRITRWLPFDINEEEVRQYVMNRMLHPQVVPTNLRDLQISQAFAREALILTVEATKQNNYEWLDADLILATG